LITILIRGNNDAGLAATHLLFSAEYAIVIHDSAQPNDTRCKLVKMM